MSEWQPQELLGIKKLNGPGPTSCKLGNGFENSPGTLYIVLVYIHTDFMPVALYTTPLDFAIINYEPLLRWFPPMPTYAHLCPPMPKEGAALVLRWCCVGAAPRKHHGSTTEAPRKHHGSTTEAPRKHHGITTETPRKHHSLGLKNKHRA